jgi:hypothetical protein
VKKRTSSSAVGSHEYYAIAHLIGEEVNGVLQASRRAQMEERRKRTA